MPFLRQCNHIAVKFSVGLPIVPDLLQQSSNYIIKRNRWNETQRSVAGSHPSTGLHISGRVIPMTDQLSKITILMMVLMMVSRDQTQIKTAERCSVSE